MHQPLSPTPHVVAPTPPPVLLGLPDHLAGGEGCGPGATAQTGRHTRTMCVCLLFSCHPCMPSHAHPCPPTHEAFAPSRWLHGRALLRPSWHGCTCALSLASHVTCPRNGPLRHPHSDATQASGATLHTRLSHSTVPSSSSVTLSLTHLLCTPVRREAPPRLWDPMQPARAPQRHPPPTAHARLAPTRPRALRRAPPAWTWCDSLRTPQARAPILRTRARATSSSCEVGRAAGWAAHQLVDRRAARGVGVSAAPGFCGSEFLRLRITLTFGPIINYLGVKLFGALRYLAHPGSK